MYGNMGHCLVAFGHGNVGDSLTVCWGGHRVGVVDSCVLAGVNDEMNDLEDDSGC